MPALRHASGRQKPPDGFSDIEDDLLVFANKMKDAENAPPVAGPRHEALWPIFQITHQRSRYIYELYYNKEAISKKLYDWLLAKGYADKNLIAKWKKQGYEKARSHSCLRHSSQIANLCSSAVFAACRLRRRILTALASVACRSTSSRKTSTWRV
jgi:bud site selection protein 31